MLKIRSRSGQSALEYGAFFVFAIAALVTMRWYFEHGVEGRIRESSRDIGEAGPFGAIEQPYYPGGTSGRSTHTWNDRTITQNVLYGVDNSGNVTTVNPAGTEASAVTTGDLDYTVNVNEALRAR
jgi:hypothetical protein